MPIEQTISTLSHSGQLFTVRGVLSFDKKNREIVVLPTNVESPSASVLFLTSIKKPSSYSMSTKKG